LNNDSKGALMYMNQAKKNMQLINTANSDYSLAAAYVPWQEWRQTYGLEEAFQKGTLFPCLYKPFSGGER
jgi:hypothetical protein